MLRFTAPHRLWLTLDTSRLVPDGHPEAAILYAIPGQEIALSLAFRLGVTGTHGFIGGAENLQCDACGLVEGHAIHAKRKGKKERFSAETKVRMPEETK